MYKLGVIGCGNMGNALIRGALNSGLIKGSELIIYDKIVGDHNREQIEYFINQGATFSESEVNLVEHGVENLMIAITPQVFKEVAEKLKGKLDKNTLLFSIAAGITLTQIQELFDHNKVLRVMPNTPALVNEGMTCLCTEEKYLEEISFAKDLFESVGRVVILDENKLDAFSGLASCMPAFVYMFIEAAADAGVKNGMERQESYEIVAQAVLGSAKMVIDTKTNPGILKDRVCSPGGTTIRGVLALEEEGFRNAVIKAVDESTNAKIKL